MLKKYNCDEGCCSIILSESSPIPPIHRTHYNHKAGVFIFDPKEDRVLLVQSRGQYWGSPKGTIEENETACECALREVKEETGIELKVEDLSKAIKIKNKAVYYYAELKTRDITVQDIQNNDANGVTWIKINCLKKLIKSGQIVINSHCKILFKKFLEITLTDTEFTPVKKSREK